MRLFESDPDDVEELFEDLPSDQVSEAQARSSLHGREFDGEAFEFLKLCGATILDTYLRVERYPIDALIQGRNGTRFYVDAHGTPDRTDRSQAGMRRQDTMLKFGFKAMRLRARGALHPLILITSHMPKPNSSSAYLLTELNEVLFDAVAIVSDFPGQQRLSAYLNDEPAPTAHLPARWREAQLQMDFDPFDEGTSHA